MKTFNFLAAVSILLVFSINNAISQENKKEETTWNFIVSAGPLGEELFFVLHGEYFMNQSTYHEKGQGICIGPVSRSEYTLEYDINKILPRLEKGGSYQWTWSMLVRRDGELVAVIHFRLVSLLNGNDIVVVERSVTRIEFMWNKL